MVVLVDELRGALNSHECHVDVGVPVGRGISRFRLRVIDTWHLRIWLWSFLFPVDGRFRPIGPLSRQRSSEIDGTRPDTFSDEEPSAVRPNRRLEPLPTLLFPTLRGFTHRQSIHLTAIATYLVIHFVQMNHSDLPRSRLSHKARTLASEEKKRRFRHDPRVRLSRFLSPDTRTCRKADEETRVGGNEARIVKYTRRRIE